MSSLQKFHRRTNGGVPSPFPTIGSGTDTIGYWLTGPVSRKVIVSPISTDSRLMWGSNGTVRGTINTTNGLVNTNTLYAFGSAAHPAAYYCKTLTLGGYNTWYLPSFDELTGCYANKIGRFYGEYYWSSTEYDGTHAYNIYMGNGNPGTMNGTKDGLTFYGNKIPYAKAIRTTAV